MKANLLIFNNTEQFEKYLSDLGYVESIIKLYVSEFLKQMKVKILDTYCLYDPNGLLKD